MSLAMSYDQNTSASTVFRYMCTFGLFYESISDPGASFPNETVTQLNAWFGIRYKFSLVDVQKLNGVNVVGVKYYGISAP